MSNILKNQFSTEELNALEQHVAFTIDVLSTETFDWDTAEDKQLRSNTVAAFKKLYAALFITEELEALYCPDHDTTFVMKNEWNGGDLISREVVGWYCGEPIAEFTEDFVGRLRAIY